MARRGLLFARYTLEDEIGGLSLKEHEVLLDRLKDARPIAYRVSDPKEHDYNTYIMAPKSRERRGEAYLTWQVCKDIGSRQVRRPNRETQTVEYEWEHTDDCSIARIVAIPRLGVLAAEDTSGEGHLNGWSAIRRFQAIVNEQNGLEFNAKPAGTPQDLSRAIKTWELEQFSFKARPFNPHPSNPGEVLSDLMSVDDIAEFRGIALPKEGKAIHPNESGLVQEAVGLADKGYATYGARGRTPSGAQAVLKPQKFSRDRQANLDRLNGPQQLRVYIDFDTEKEAVRGMVDALLEFFDPDTKSTT